ncbi:MAG: hypothetical protein SH809_14670 [Rhodothermales bacterium]|nr:hypothetical protein [Rhodothermales bacterium]
MCLFVFATPASGQDLRKPAAPVYDLIALRVEFQPDTTRFTTGNGTFDHALFDTLTTAIDPLPHDAGYFEAHLAFLENYVARVSDGQTTVRTHLLPEVVRVSGGMAAYSPTGLDAESDAERAKLADLVAEAWTLAGTTSSFDVSGFDPSTTAFMLFHAGVGRDIELIGTILDKTPQDLPSIYFGEDALERLAGAVSFKGLPVTSTMIIPRTESRKGFDFLGDREFLIGFSINGLMAASFFNYLGVPDLFNTEDGQSAIGPFGLMDPLGLFAYNGLLAPEPEAWTKYFLGWIEPALVTGPDPITSTLRPASDPASSDAVRVPISGAEYFLVEHRRRDVEKDGLVLQVYRNGQIEEQRYANGQEDFNGVNVDAFAGGVVVDADNFDWALPGGLDEDDNALDGGLLIWHVDERVIAEGLASNRVNADPNRRGVDLEEADSGQDLGFPSENPFAPQSHLGSPFDFYYEGNPVIVIAANGEEVRLYENRFGPATHPNSRSNDGANSFVVLEDFSPREATMQFTYRRAVEDGFLPIDGLPVLSEVGFERGSYIMRAGDGALVVANTRDLVVVRDGVVLRPGPRVGASPVIGPDGAVYFIYETLNRIVGVGKYDEGSFTTVPFNLEPDYFAVSDRASLVYDEASGLFAAILWRDGEQVLITFDPFAPFSGPTLPVTVVDGVMPLAIAAAPGAGLAVWTLDGVTVAGDTPDWSFSLPDSRVGQLALGSERGQLVGVAPQKNGTILHWLLAGGEVRSVPLSTWGEAGEALPSFPTLVDVDDDGRLDAVVVHGRQLLAISQGGGMADGFPIALPAEVEAQPLVARFSADSPLAIVVAALDGNVYAYDLATPGELVAGFPLAVGRYLQATPLLQDGQLFAVDDKGVLAGWAIDGLHDIWWGRLFQGNTNASFVTLTPPAPEPQPGDGLLVAAETYNWPNPIRDGRTFVRIRPTRDVRVRITIVDAAGGLVDRIDVSDARAGVPTDILWQTDAASGLYYARIEATDASGSTETALIKLAVIR